MGNVLSEELFDAEGGLWRLFRRAHEEASVCMETRQPDRRPVTDDDGAEMRDHMRVFARAVEIMAEERERGNRPSSNNHGGVESNGSKMFYIWATVVIGAIIAIQGLIFTEITDIKQRMAVIECRMSPECAKVLIQKGVP